MKLRVSFLLGVFTLSGLLIGTVAGWSVSAAESPSGEPRVRSDVSSLNSVKLPPSKLSSVLKNVEGPITQAEMVVGPFDIHRKYRSMEGPFVNHDIAVGDFLNSKTVTVVPSKVAYTEGGAEAPGMSNSAPTMFNSGPNAGQPIDDNGLIGLSRRNNQTRELYWFKGIKIEVLDENNKVMPTAEFICHFNLDINVDTRNRLFPDGERTNNPRLVSLTQGETEFYFPEGYGVPVASDELWRLGFQAANRTSEEHRRLKQRCIVYFVKDSDLKKPIVALDWYVPYCAVIVDRNTKMAAAQEHAHSPSCLSSQPGVVAPNRGAQLSVLTDNLGRRLSGHWVVPPGEHMYSSPIVDSRDPGFSSKDRVIHAAWTHIHPLCTQTSLVQCDGESKRSLYTAKIDTKTDGGLEIKDIQAIFSKQGIRLPKGQHYELQGVYNNTTGVPQDSMISHGIFFEDNTYKNPVWVKSAVLEASAQRDKAETVASQYAAPGLNEKLFNAINDGPLLTSDKYIEVETTAGKIHLVLEPNLAPQNATYLYRMLVSGAYSGTPVFEYHPDFLIQFGNPDLKANGQPQLPSSFEPKLRRLPLEVDAQLHRSARHHTLALSMARGPDTNSATGSFCIMLTDAKQLDGKYTIFGHVLGDDVTKATLLKIGTEWSRNKAWITDAHELLDLKKTAFETDSRESS